MSQAANTTPTRVAVSWLGWAALALATVAVAVVLSLAIASGDDTKVETSAPAATAPVTPGIRYDGGPEEGTRGPFAAPSNRPAPSVRYDGGPEEGTRGPR